MGDFKLLAGLLGLLIFGQISASDIPVSSKLPLKDKTGFSMEKLRMELNRSSELEKNKGKEKKSYQASGSKEALMVSLKLMGYLTVVIFLIYAAIRLLKKSNIGSGFRSRGGREGSIELLDSAYVGQNKNISLVKVLNRVLVLGVTDGQISLLSEINERPVVDKLVSRHREKPGEVGLGFSTTINKFLEKFSKGEPFRSIPGGRAVPVEQGSA